MYQDSNTTKNKLNFFRMALCRSRAKTVHLVKRVTNLSQEYTISTGTQTINVAKTLVMFLCVLRIQYCVLISLRSLNAQIVSNTLKEPSAQFTQNDDILVQHTPVKCNVRHLNGAMAVNTKLNYFGETYRTNNPGGAVKQFGPHPDNRQDSITWLRRIHSLRVTTRCKYAL